LINAVNRKSAIINTAVSTYNLRYAIFYLLSFFKISYFYLEKKKYFCIPIKRNKK